MLADAIRQLYAYNSWATRRVLTAAEKLSAEQLYAPGTAGHGSIRDTLLHLMQAHRGWLSWWDGSLSAEESYGLRMNPDEYPDVASLQLAWREIEQQTEAFIERLDGEGTQRRLEWRLPDGRVWGMSLWGMMLHVANHGTQHRAEAAAMLTAAGHSPGNQDLLYFMERPLDAPDGEDI